MRDEARVPESTTIATYSLSIPYGGGIETGRISTPNFLFSYLGHQHLSGTQRYLHLTAEIFPEITARVNAAFGDVIPRRIQQ
jgi:hypothetical protein